MASLSRASKPRLRYKHKLRKRGQQETSRSYADTPVLRSREPSSMNEGQLASPPVSSGCIMPLGFPDMKNNVDDASESPNKEDEEEEKEEDDETGDRTQKQMLSSSASKTEPSTNLPSPQTLPREVFEQSDDSKALSLIEKVKLLKICCDHGSQFLHCPTSGKHADEEVWTSIMKEFSITVRSGVFIKYSDVRKATSKTCRNRRKNTKGNVPPRRRSRMGDLDTWIDRWVRIWKCRDLVVNLANAHQSMLETIGEEKFKRIFQHRMDGNELPHDLGRLTLSPPLWKTIRKRIHLEERSLGIRHMSLFPGEESDWTDEEGIEEDELEGTDDDQQAPIKSIEETQDSRPEAQDDMEPTPDGEVEGDLDLPDPSPRTQAKLDEFERGYTTILREEQCRTGERTSILSLVHKRQEQEQPLSTPPSKLEEIPKNGAMQPQLEQMEAANQASSEVESRERDGSTSLFVGKSTPSPSDADLQRSASINPNRIQRLKPGTYCRGEEVQVGFHTQQVILAGANNTATRDYRQGVYAKVDISGRVRLRLRAQNMQGKQVPDQFCLNVSTVYPKDVIYLPKFHGMSYDEVRREVARQSLLPVDQRVRHEWVPTPIAKNDGEENESTSVSKSQGKRSCRDVDSDGDIANKSRKISSEGSHPQASIGGGERGFRETPSVSVLAETRLFTASKPRVKQPREDHPVRAVGHQYGLSTLKPQEMNTYRTSTPDVLRQFLADEARKKQRPLAPHRIPYHSSPPRRLNPVGQMSTKNRITPSRFYGADPSGRDIIEGGPRPLEPHQQTANSHQPGSSSDIDVGLPQRKETLPTLDHVAPDSMLAHDDSDNDSLPDVEELHSRCIQAAKARASPQHIQQDVNPGDPIACVADKKVGVPASSRPQGSRQTSSQGYVPVYRPENTDVVFGRTVENREKPTNDGPRGQEDEAITPSGPHSNKRERCQPMADSSGNACTSSSKPSATPKGPGAVLENRQMPPLSSSYIQTPVPVPKLPIHTLKPLWRPSIGSTAQSSGVFGEENRRPSLGPLDDGKDKAFQSRPQNEQFVANPRPSNENNHAHKWKTGAKNNTQSRRFHPYGQPGSPSGPTTSQTRRKSGGGGGGRRQRQKAKDCRDRSTNRFLREFTTDTVDFENFSLDRKCDFLRRKMSRMEEMLRKIEKDD